MVLSSGEVFNVDMGTTDHWTAAQHTQAPRPGHRQDD